MVSLSMTSDETLSMRASCPAASVKLLKMDKSYFFRKGVKDALLCGC